MSAALVPILLGAAFGWILQRTGLSRYERIVGIFRFEDLAVLKVLLTALATAAIGLRVLAAAGLATDLPVPSTYVWGNLAGGVVFGVGMALSGFCPGTVAAGAGEGRLDNLVAGGAGLFSGALVYGLAYERLMPFFVRSGRPGAVTLPAMVHAEPWLVVIVFAEVVVLVFYVVRRLGHRDAARRAGGAQP